MTPVRLSVKPSRAIDFVDVSEKKGREGGHLGLRDPKTIGRGEISIRATPCIDSEPISFVHCSKN